MSLDLTCPACGFTASHNIVGDCLEYYCPICGYAIKIRAESSVVGGSRPNLSEELADFDNGDVVEVIQEDHPWDGEIAIVREVRHKFCRIELNGELVLVPSQWLKLHEPYDTTS